MADVVFITKYALTTGIVERIAIRFNEDYVVVKDEHGLNGTDMFFGEGRQWHRSYNAAAARADKMRVARIASLRKQIAKLEKLEFTAEDA